MALPAEPVVQPRPGVVLLVAPSPVAQAPSGAILAALGLIRRVLPERAGAFRCELLPASAGRDAFEVVRDGPGVLLRGTDANALAMAFNWYLRRVALLDFSWQAEGPLHLAGPLPMPETPVRRACQARERFFLNACTFGYSFSWWHWEQWQRFLDWMAMNGINRPLLQGGQEWVWLRVWQSFGLPERDILAYFTGPAHLPWHRMGNLDGWGGPLSITFLRAQCALQKQVLARARELGMKPILPGFAGHVPPALAVLHPQAAITRLGTGWGGLDPAQQACCLAPGDPLFQDIAGRFIREQAAEYGTDHLYAADPFNEMAPPTWDPGFLGAVAGSIYRGMATADPEAVWYQMTWTFTLFPQWADFGIGAMARAVPRGRLVFLDYAGEEREFYREPAALGGAPFLWCYLGNFGGNTHLVAPLRKLATRAGRALAQPQCLGVGSTLEGLNGNAVAYDLLLELPWQEPADRADWIRAYAARRAGGPDPAVLEAWRLLADKVLLDTGVGIQTRGSRLQAIPDLWGQAGRVRTEHPYSDRDLVRVVRLLLQAGATARNQDGYRFDLVDLFRQVLANLMDRLHQRLGAAWRSQDLPAFRSASQRFLAVGRDLDALLGCRREFLLGSWLAGARGWAQDAGERRVFERGARELLTTWHQPGSELADYGCRQWNGLIRSFYLVRWEAFLARAEAALAKGEPLDEPDYTRWRLSFERRWVASVAGVFAERPFGNPFAHVQELMAKYEGEFEAGMPDGRSETAESLTAYPGGGRLASPSPVSGFGFPGP